MTQSDKLALSELFLANFSPLQCLEFLEALNGEKISRINLYLYQLPTISSLCQKFGLHLQVSEYGIQERTCTEGKGNWSNVGQWSRSKHSHQMLRFVYIGRNKASTRRAYAIDQNNSNIAKELGGLLNIPECCTTFFLNNKEVALKAYADDYTLVIPAPTKWSVDWRVNFLSQYFGYSLIHFYPCSWTCIEAIKRAEFAYSLVESYSSVWASTYRENMSGLFLHENRLGVHALPAHSRISEREFITSTMKSTAETRLGRKLLNSQVATYEGPTQLRLDSSLCTLTNKRAILFR